MDCSKITVFEQLLVKILQFRSPQTEGSLGKTTRFETDINLQQLTGLSQKVNIRNF
jgi:hypothetical protein